MGSPAFGAGVDNSEEPSGTMRVTRANAQAGAAPPTEPKESAATHQATADDVCRTLEAARLGVIGETHATAQGANRCTGRT